MFRPNIYSRGSNKGMFKNVPGYANIIIDSRAINDEIRGILEKHIFNQSISIISTKDSSIDFNLLNMLSNNNNTISFTSYNEDRDMVLSFMCGNAANTNTIIVVDANADKYQDMLNLYNNFDNKLFIGSDLESMCKKLKRHFIQKHNEQKILNGRIPYDMPVYDDDEE